MNGVKVKYALNVVFTQSKTTCKQGRKTLAHFITFDSLLVSTISGKREMGVFQKKINREQLNPGDHIYSWRLAGVYAHHGIYVGDGMVIHFTTGAGQETGTVLDRISQSSTGTPCRRCGGLSRSDGVISSCLDCFLKGGRLYLFEYGVSGATCLAKTRAGTCTIAPSDSSDDTLHRARSLLANGFGGYNLFKNNCEDFAIYCKTSMLVFNFTSAQVASFLNGSMCTVQGTLFMASAIAFGPFFYPIAAIGVFGCSAYHRLSRLSADMARCNLAAKVPVESLIASPAGLN